MDPILNSAVPSGIEGAPAAGRPVPIETDGLSFATSLGAGGPGAPFGPPTPPVPPVVPATAVELFARLEQMPQRVAAMQARHRTELAAVPRGSDEYERLSRQTNADLLQLQIEAHHLQFHTELVSKFVEHTVSGIKTSMQTQA